LPLLDLSPCDIAPDHAHLSIVYLAGLMLWPGDAIQMERFRASALVHKLKIDIDGGDLPHDTFTPEEWAGLFKIATLAPPFSEVVQASVVRYYHGLALGQFICEIIARKDRRSKNATIGQTMATVTKFCKDFGWRVSKSTLVNTIWPDFRAVAHLWAAKVRRLPFDRRGFSFDITPTFVCPPEELAQFLAMAEWYRSRGEELESNKTNLLGAGQTWRVPPEITLPPVATQRFQPQATASPVRSWRALARAGLSITF